MHSSRLGRGLSRSSANNRSGRTESTRADKKSSLVFWKTLLIFNACMPKPKAWATPQLKSCDTFFVVVVTLASSCEKKKKKKKGAQRETVACYRRKHKKSAPNKENRTPDSVAIPKPAAPCIYSWKLRRDNICFSFPRPSQSACTSQRPHLVPRQIAPPVHLFLLPLDRFPGGHAVVEHRHNAPVVARLHQALPPVEQRRRERLALRCVDWSASRHAVSGRAGRRNGTEVRQGQQGAAACPTSLRNPTLTKTSHSREATFLFVRPCPHISTHESPAPKPSELPRGSCQFSCFLLMKLKRVS